MSDQLNNQRFVDWFRGSAPYIHAFRDRTFVIVIGGEILNEQGFAPLAHDLALLNGLGIRLVLVHGARPQIEARLKARSHQIQYINGQRVTDDVALQCVIEAAGSLRVEIEALLSMGLANSPMAGARIRATSGNFVTARPVGVRDGINFGHTGQVRRIDHAAIAAQLDQRAIVLLPPLGYSPTGEVFNLSAIEVGAAVASALRADKLICLTERTAGLPRQLTLDEAQSSLAARPGDDDLLHGLLSHAVHACRHGVRRAHLLDRHVDGALLLELFTRDGVGTMINADVYEGTRGATLEDIGGILELIAPLEDSGVLVRRSREKLEMEIDDYLVIERDGMIIACAALHLFPACPLGELACLAVHPSYHKGGYGNSILESIAARARERGLNSLFVLTTEASHWFRERGFEPGTLQALPMEKQALINYQRNSQVFIKQL
ncbi:MAG: amino-acid N-acetyltransferase [Gammaproteobacteria bacterium]|nr:amino-acid N-acetyltransferase [Gammaproteobacteria bacterium]